MKIEEIVELLRKTADLAGLLIYMKESGRYKEHPGYENKTFESYVVEVRDMDLIDVETLMYFYSASKKPSEKTAVSDPAIYWRQKVENLEQRIAEIEKQNRDLKKEKSH